MVDLKATRGVEDDGISGGNAGGLERRHANGKDALAAGYKALTDFVASQKVSYDELMFSLKSAA